MKKFVLWLAMLTLTSNIYTMNPLGTEEEEEEIREELVEPEKETADRGEKRKAPTGEQSTQMQSPHKLQCLEVSAAPETLHILLEECHELPKKTEQLASLYHTFTKEDIDYLVAQNFDPNKRNNQNQTVINALINHGNLNGARYLIKLFGKKLDVNTPDKFGVDPLQNAIIQKDLDLAVALIRLLHEQGNLKDLNKTNKAGDQTIFLAAKHMPELVALFMDGPVKFNRPIFFDHLVKHNKLNTSLSMVFWHPLVVPKIPELIAKGADVNTTYFTISNPSEKLTLLMVAAKNSTFLDKLKILLANGASVNLKTSQGNTALMYGIIRKNNEAIKLLLQGGADVNASNNGGFTPLMLAAESNFFALQPLINKGAQLETKDNVGWTALRHAVDFNNIPAIVALLKAGAYIFAADKSGISVLDAARHMHNKNAVELLLASEQIREEEEEEDPTEKENE